MSIYECSGAVNITTQADIDNWLLSYPNCTVKQSEFDIRNASGSLNFTRVITVDAVVVQDSPQLEALAFPILTGMDTFELNTYNGIYISNSCFGLPELFAANEVEINDMRGCGYGWQNATSLTRLSLKNSSDITLGFSSTAIDQALLVESSTSLINLLSNSIDLTGIHTVGSEANFTSNYHATVNLVDLGTAASLFANNNTECTFDFSQLSKVTNLTMIDNPATMIPSFPSLTSATNIHLRSNINTSLGPNFFPALTGAGNVTIEAWNDDFSCSKLVLQQQNGLIKNLACNGTDNSTATSAPTHSSASSLSGGAWAGIGVSTGVVVLGAALVWITLHFRRRFAQLEGRASAQQPVDVDSLFTEPTQVYSEDTHEAEGQGIIREKPDDHMREMYVRPEETASTQILEMDAAPVEPGWYARDGEDGELRYMSGHRHEGEYGPR
ncbi:Uu.00g093130.m01.CDS01 [Anthostomella pinea]|uniref:Uu.00g093130.m01.CDS01 n=1 Tax=Anthostomella pinea TaxID=933095 RepID=A0AAI8VP38_9PEZI|nr:Uu.00g093130.m01.CDS01 [Anthostomella pinea]